MNQKLAATATTNSGKKRRRRRQTGLDLVSAVRATPHPWRDLRAQRFLRQN